MADTRSLVEHFEILTDPRIERAKKHSLRDILVIAICAVICDADGWEDIEQFGKSREVWLKTFLDLKNGVPCHDTFARVFARLEPKAFQRCFVEWISTVHATTAGQVVPIDGKTLRRSFDKAKALGALHLVSAWSLQNKLVLGQVKVDAKSNEIPAISELLDLLSLRGCIVTIDAIGCQRDIADKIIANQGDYVLALKGNQKGLHDKVQRDMDGADHARLTARFGAPLTMTEKEHGRLEERRYWLTSDLSWLSGASEWPGMRGLGIAERSTESNGSRVVERRYFLVSFGGNLPLFASAARGHWSIESMHWCLDVTFREDLSQTRKGHGPENFAMLRRAALSLLKQAPGPKMSLAKRRYRAALEEGFLLQCLSSEVRLANE